MARNIIIIGFMGCGKTSIGKRLAMTLNRKFIDTDLEIENSMKMPIADIFQNYGEDFFRKLEQAFCEQIENTSNNIIATGGGMIRNKKNMNLLKTNGIIVYLKCSPQKIYRNVKSDESRPLLNVENKFEKIEQLLQQRIPAYEKYAQITIDVSENTIENSVKDIINAINLYEKN